MDQNQDLYKKFRQELQTFYRYTLRGVIIIVAAMLYIIFTGKETTNALALADGTFLLIVFGIFLLIHALAFLLKRKIRADILKLNSTTARLKKYKNYYLTGIVDNKLVMTVSLLAYSLSGLNVLLLFAALSVAAIILQKPSVQKFVKVCELPDNEAEPAAPTTEG